MDELSTIAIIYRRPEATVLVSMLRAYGIPAFVPTWNVTNAAPHWTVLVGGLPVLVPSAELEAALALIGASDEVPLPQRDFRGGRAWNIVVVLIFGLLPILSIAHMIYIPPPRARGAYARLPAA